MDQSDFTSPSVASLINVTGQVQGVGFRPFIYRIAQQYRINGWVQNRQGEVLIHAEGFEENLKTFTSAIIGSAPPLARPEIAKISSESVEGFQQFTIKDSASGTHADIHLPADQFTCSDCLEELNNPSDRRYNYPFINCTQCGPRYTIIESLPYDRPATSMAGFPLCSECGAEYQNPSDRRFHAEPIACPVCGPQLSFFSNGQSISNSEAVLNETVKRLQQGEVVAVKGIGGYHLLCDAANEAAVKLLRQRKRRPDKPLAVMFPQRGDSLLDDVLDELRVTDVEAMTLRSAERPIVLCRKSIEGKLAPSIAPGLAEIGVMLPYSPLHHLLLSRFEGPLVATSGNISGEPVITDNHEA
ncbi:MAG: Sua5/YciO/YrdC/YwlC family protein, partial [Gammaproteobacteria bacterium]|nr:Sua5/YciO/YrdC/YwlC family protein [Gammaproteobacteria bacterium]